MEGDTINCTIQSGRVICNGTEYDVFEPPLSYQDTMFWVFLALYIGLVLFAGLMSGLTLGLLSLDMTSLRVVMEAGSDKDKKYAARIIPIVKRHHLLLVTLLLANAAAVETMPIFLDRVSDPLIAILVSVTAVLLFGEVFPQALCSRYGLAIGYYLSPLVYFLMVVCFIISYPLAKLLDCMLGHEHGTFFRKSELKVLVDLHGPDGVDGRDELTYDEVLIIKGALELGSKTVQDSMLPLEDVYMLDVDTILDTNTTRKIMRAAHSRIPVFEQSKENVLGVLLVKTLVGVEWADKSLRNIIADRRYSRPVHTVNNTTPLYDLLNDFQKGKSHLALVTKHSPSSSVEGSWTIASANSNANREAMKHKARISGSICGIITLEDVLEELLQEEIIDETDVYVDVRNRVRVARAKSYITRSASMNTDSSAYTDVTQSSQYRSFLPRIPSTDAGRPRHHYDRSDSTPLLA